MYSRKRFHDITNLEYFLFGGAPEAPEPVFERDVQSFAEPRRARRDLARASAQRETPKGRLLGRICIR